MATINGTAYADVLKGTIYGDFLYGGGGNDVLYGYAGNDRIDGGTGADSMYGGAGNDTYIVDNLSDLIFESSAQGTDRVLTSISYWLGPNVERLATTNPLGTAPLELEGNDLANAITGNAGDNYIRGGAGADFLSGLGGNDTLIGDSGIDRLTGGAGSDTFVFTDTDQSRDTITDFVSGTDKIDLGWWVTEMGGATFHFIGGSGFTHHAGEGRYADGLFQLDANGDGLADLTIHIAGQVAAGDFTLSAVGYWDY
jgi:Ca2+-binding RTX toxin-like protein